MKSAQGKTSKREVAELVMRGLSASPDVALMERLAEWRGSTAEDAAILAAWRPTLCIAPVYCQ